jgi:hypothetical protein
MGAIDWTKPIQARDGRKARYLGRLGGSRHAVAVASPVNETELALTVSDGGFGFDVDSASDIINRIERYEGYVTVAPGWRGRIHATADQARRGDSIHGGSEVVHVVVEIGGAA